MLENKDKNDSNYLEDQENEEEFDSSIEDISFIEIEEPKYKFLKELPRDILFIIIDLALIMALNGYFDFAKMKLIDVIIFGLVFTIIEFAIKTVVGHYFIKLFTYSLGLITLPIIILSLYLSRIIVGIEVDDRTNLIWFYILFIIVRSIFRLIFIRNDLRKYMKGKQK